MPKQIAMIHTVTALVPTECLVLTRWVFNTTLRSDPLIAVAMLPYLSQRIRQAEEITRKPQTSPLKGP